MSLGKPSDGFREWERGGLRFLLRVEHGEARDFGFEFQPLPALGLQRLGRCFARGFAFAPPRLAPFDEESGTAWPLDPALPVPLKRRVPPAVFGEDLPEDIHPSHKITPTKWTLFWTLSSTDLHKYLKTKKYWQPDL